MGIKKIHVTVNVDLFIIVDEDIDIQDVIDDLDYNFSSNTEGARVEDTFIVDYNVTDSR